MDKLLFIGSTVADVVIRVPGLPHTGDDLNIMSQRASLGGCAYNAFTAARLTGADCTLFSPVGTGMWGDWVRQAMQERGVASAVPPVDDPNGCCYCLVEPDGERTFLCEHGAEYRFLPEWFDNLQDAWDGVYVCGLEIEEPTGDVIIDYLESHPPRALYFAPGPRICHIPPARMARLLTLHPVLHLNEAEACRFACADTAEEAAIRIAGVTQSDVVITLGSEGVYVLHDGAGTLVPACPAHVVDAIGAGDAHVGALMSARHAGRSLPEAARLANRMSAAVVSHAGATLTPDEWDEYQKKEE